MVIAGRGFLATSARAAAGAALLLAALTASTAASAQVTIDGLGNNADVCTNASGQIVSRNSGALAGCSSLVPVAGTGTGISIGGGNLNITGGGNVSVTGGNITTDQAVQGGTLTSTGDTNVGGALGVTGNYTTTNGNITTTNGTIEATNGQVNANAAVIGTGGLFANGDVSVVGNYNSTNGSITLTNGQLNAGAAVIGTGGLFANGDATVAGLTTTNTLAVTSNATVGGTLGVTGLTTTNGINNTGTFANTGDITNTGNYSTTNGNITTTNGNITATNGTVSGNAVTAGAGGLTANGPTQLNGSVTVAPGQTVSMGGNRVQNVAAPVAATDAANKAYVDAGTTALNNRLNDAFKKIDENTQGIAIAIAMGGLALPTNKSFAIGANIGFYDGKQAAAANAALRISDTITLNGGIGVGFDGGAVGGRVGIMAAF